MTEHKEGHLEEDAIKYIRERRLNAEFYARRGVARDIGLLPPSKRVQPPIPQQEYAMSNRLKITLCSLGLAVVLIILFMINTDLIPETIVIEKTEVHEITQVINTTIIQREVFIPDPEIIEKEIIIEENLPVMDYKGKMWCNGDGMCYKTQ